MEIGDWQKNNLEKKEEKKAWPQDLSLSVCVFVRTDGLLRKKKKKRRNPLLRADYREGCRTKKLAGDEVAA